MNTEKVWQEEAQEDSVHILKSCLIKNVNIFIGVTNSKISDKNSKEFLDKNTKESYAEITYLWHEI